ncbi:MAG TPA: hypothetical protein VD862_01085 [Candidatus Paceibacterota bacterium]|nr:hypothetical protein [Candidatus Paceibacterota bacterium]
MTTTAQTNRLLVIAGGRAVGKTYWADAILTSGRFDIARVKTRTTREPRDARDHETYRFMDESGFRALLASGSLLEHDYYRQAYYGSSLGDMHDVLARSHGLIVLTAAGVHAVARHAAELNARVLLFLPDNRRLMERNLDLRNITDPALRASLMDEAESYAFGPGVPHAAVRLSGDDADGDRVFRAVAELLG